MKRILDFLCDYGLASLPLLCLLLLAYFSLNEDTPDYKPICGFTYTESEDGKTSVTGVVSLDRLIEFPWYVVEVTDNKTGGIQQYLAEEFIKKEDNDEAMIFVDILTGKPIHDGPTCRVVENGIIKNAPSNNGEQELRIISPAADWILENWQSFPESLQQYHYNYHDIKYLVANMRIILSSGRYPVPKNFDFLNSIDFVPGTPQYPIFLEYDSVGDGQYIISGSISAYQLKEGKFYFVGIQDKESGETSYHVAELTFSGYDGGFTVIDAYSLSTGQPIFRGVQISNDPLSAVCEGQSLSSMGKIGDYINSNKSSYTVEEMEDMLQKILDEKTGAAQTRVPQYVKEIKP